MSQHKIHWKSDALDRIPYSLYADDHVHQQEQKRLFQGATWNYLCLEVDVAKNARGVAAAGVRARKGLRALQGKSKELVKLTIELEKSSKPEAPPQPEAPAPAAKKAKK